MDIALHRRRLRTTSSVAALFLAAYGPHGMVLDFADASISINDAADLLDFESSGQVSNGALVGPGAKLTYSAPSLKLTEQADGFIKFQAHNLYLNSAAPANQSVTTGMLTGATYAMTLTGSVSITLSGAATGTITAGTTTFTAASGTLTCGSTSGSGTVHLRRTPSVDTYVATTTAAVYDLPYVYSSGVRTSVLFEEASTGLFPNSRISSLAITAGNTVTANARADVFGGNAADLYQRTATQSYRGTSLVKAASALPYTVTTIVERNVGDYLCLTAQGTSSADRTRTTFDLNAGTVSRAATSIGGFTGATSGMELLPNGRALCWVSFTTDASTGVSAYLSVAESNILNVDTHDTGTTASCWVSYIQIEQKAFRTSPIITYGSTVLRAADTPNALLNLFPSIGTAYTIYAKYKPQSASVATTAIRLDDTTTNELVSLGNNASGQGLATVTDGGAAQAAITSGTITASAFHRVAASVEGNNVRFVVNGGAEVQDASVTLPTLTRLLLTAGGGMELVQLAILPGARTEAQLQALGA